MKRRNARIIGIALIAAGTGCLPKKAQLEAEGPRILEKPGSDAGALPKGTGSRSDLYVREDRISVSPIDDRSANGSLFDPEDERNYLFLTRPAISVDKVIEVAIRLPTDGKLDNEKDVGTKAKDGNSQAAAPEDEILKSLPNLEPEVPGARIAKSLKMKVKHKFPNGDILVSTERLSDNGQTTNEITVNARIPGNKVTAGMPFSTDDLTEVSFVETTGNQRMTRNSNTWEDEYTLRFSGFNEAKSKLAQRLDLQREQLKKAREELKNRLTAMGKEREQMASERNKLMEKDAASQKSIEGLTKSLAERDAQIKTQLEQLSTQQKDGNSEKPPVDEGKK